MKDDYDEEVCNTKLELAIGSNDFVYKKDKRDEHHHHHHQIMKSKNKRVVTCLDLSLPLDNYKDDEDEDDGSSAKEIINININNNNINGEEGGQISNSSCSIDVNEENNNKRKKLRLSIEQSCVLEDCFKQHTTLNMAQKYALAEKLNLKPRQIEVWFQNRRARTKLKQTEVNCVLLKKCCENLKEENTRLKKELEEMRSLIIKRAAFCHSCKKIARSSPDPN